MARRAITLSVVVVWFVLLAMLLDSNVRKAAVKRSSLLLAGATWNLEAPSAMAGNDTEVSQSLPEPLAATGQERVAKANAGTQNLNSAGAAMELQSPSSEDAFCRCSQTGGDHPPVGESFAQAVLRQLLEEMRRELRMYIYPVDFHCSERRPKAINRGFTVDWKFYDRARSSAMRVSDPEKATIFYIPTFTYCWRGQGRSRFQGGVAAGKRMHQMLSDVAKLPFFHRHSGKKHIWMSVHDMGKQDPLMFWCGNHACDQSSRDLLQMLAKNGSVLANTADDLEPLKDGKYGGKLGEYGFNSTRDVSLVCNSDSRFAQRGFSAKANRVRPYSVFFAGTWGGKYAPVREVAIRSIEAAKLQKQTRIYQKMIKDQAYEKALMESELCLAPRGSRVWSPRLFEMMWFGCIPVIIADGYHLPASCFFDWREFSIFIAEKDADKVHNVLVEAGQILKVYLDDPKRLELLRAKVLQVRRIFVWHDEDTPGDAFELAMLDVYLKQQRSCG